MKGYLFFFSVMLLLSYFVYYFTMPNYRMFMFFPVIGLILWARFVSNLKLSSLNRGYLDCLMVIMLLFNFSTCFFEGNTNANRWKTLFSLQNPQERTPVKYSPFFDKEAPAWEFIDNHLQPDEPLGYVGYHDSWVFPYFDNRLKRKIYHLKGMRGYLLKEFQNKKRLVLTDGLLQQLKQKKIRFLHINPQGWHYKRPKATIIDDNRAVAVTPHLFYINW